MSSAGPTLPPHLRNSQDETDSDSDNELVGPALPPGYKRGSSDDSEEEVSPKRAKTSHATGNQQENAVTEEEDDDDGFFGPALPPGFKKQESSPDPTPAIGPALPPGFRKPSYDDEEEEDDSEDEEDFSGPALPPGYQHQASSSEDEDEDVIGPMPSKGPTEDSVALDIERRAQRMKDKLSGKDAPVAPARESWMTELPPELQHIGLGARTFKKKSGPEKEKGEVDLTGAKQNTGVWLVKVPKYLSQQWAKAPGRGEVGKIRICKKGNLGKPEVTFTLNEELTIIEGINTVAAPREHPFTMQSVGGQTLAVFTEMASGQSEERSDGSSLGSSAGPDKIALEGMVVQRAECRPAVSESYMKLKRLQIEESSKPARLSQQLDKAVTSNYKPLEYERRKKEEGKRARADKQQVLDMLFSAFEKHQYYNIKDLVDITKQPVIYLKEILRDIGIYNVKGTHKNTWELKPEYRHYQGEEKTEDE
uniref:General transcription factor IIF subunit 2 n=1 Tax=Knipowitschia caucasica TaxID=637954 RepID=A0AAV2LML9_KNICA